jgi:phosphoglycerol geranylgeranyltransferase
MKRIYKDIKTAITKRERLLAVLIDPDKFEITDVESFIKKVNASIASHIFVGGSKVDELKTEALVIEIKNQTSLPIVLFPGDVNQVTNKADGILFLSLISGRNPDYLIGKHIEAVSTLRETTLEVIPTGYILIESGNQTSVERVSETKPLANNAINYIQNTAKAGELLGMQLIYLEAGSGATHPIKAEIISRVKQDLKIPLIVGGGIRTKMQLNKAYKAGADVVVIGTVFENDEAFFEKIKK